MIIIIFWNTAFTKVTCVCLWKKTRRLQKSCTLQKNQSYRSAHTIRKFIAENANLCFAELFPVRNEIVTYSKPSAFELNVPDEQDHKDDIGNDSRNIHDLNTAALRYSSLCHLTLFSGGCRLICLDSYWTPPGDVVALFCESSTRHKCHDLLAYLTE